MDSNNNYNDKDKGEVVRPALFWRIEKKNERTFQNLWMAFRIKKKKKKKKDGKSTKSIKINKNSTFT